MLDAIRRSEPVVARVSDVPAYLLDLIAEQRRPAREARGTIYRALYRAAQRGDLCPSSEVLNELCGYSSVSMVPRWIKHLERDGLIRVWRYQRSRMVEIVATGKRTAPSTETLPHWRERSIHRDRVPG